MFFTKCFFRNSRKQNWFCDGNLFSNLKIEVIFSFTRWPNFSRFQKFEEPKNTHQLICDLKKELNDYKIVNEILENNCKNLEHNLQEKSFIFNQTLMEMRKEGWLMS